MGFTPPQLERWFQQGKFKNDNDRQVFLKDLGKTVGEGMIKIYEQHLFQLQQSYIDICPD